MKKSVSVLLIVTMLIGILSTAAPTFVSSANEDTNIVSSGETAIEDTITGSSGKTAVEDTITGSSGTTNAGTKNTDFSKFDDSWTKVSSVQDFIDNSTEDKFYLTNDITLTSAVCEKIYAASTDNNKRCLITGWRKSGTIEVEGNGYTIIYDGAGVPLMSGGQDTAGATVRNLNFAGTVALDSRENNHWAPVIRHGFSGGPLTLENVHSSVAITAGNGYDIEGVIGGVIGKTEKSTVLENVFFTGSIDLGSTPRVGTNDDTKTIGGIAGTVIGTLNANNITAAGEINISGQNLPYVGGAFGKVKKAITVTNATLDSTITIGGAESKKIGGLISAAYGEVNLSNIKASGSITVTEAAASYIGGLVGFLGTKGTILKCKNTSNITQTSGGTVKGSHVGGLVGIHEATTNSDSLTIVECFNSGDIITDSNGERAIGVGGLVGQVDPQNGLALQLSVTIANCVNSGNITTRGAMISAGGMLGDAFTVNRVSLTGNKNTGNITCNGQNKSGGAGGMLGIYRNITTADVQTGILLINNCTNEGTIKGTVAGGMLGKGLGLTKSDATAIVAKCINSGAIESIAGNATTLVHAAGGIIGAYGEDNNGFGGFQVKNCLNKGNVTANVNSGKGGGIVGYVAATGACGTTTVSASANSGTITAVGTSGGIMGSCEHEATLTNCATTTATLTGASTVNATECTTNVTSSVIEEYEKAIKEAATATFSAEYTASTDIAWRGDGTVKIKINEVEDIPDRFDIYWGNATGKLSGYSEIGSVSNITSKTITFDMPSNIKVPEGADRILVYAITGIIENPDFATANLPKGAGEAAETLGTPLYTFNVISDTHVSTETYYDKYFTNARYEDALRDIVSISPETLGIFVNGDLVEWGLPEEYQASKDIIAKVAQDTGYTELADKMHYGIGNHDFYNVADADTIGVSAFKSWSSIPETTRSVEDRMAIFLAGTDASKRNNSDKPYYDVKVGDMYAIFLGTDDASANPDRSRGAAYLSDEQLDWFEAKLEEHTATSESPVFVFLHQGIGQTVAGTYNNLTQEAGGMGDQIGTNSEERLNQIYKDYKDSIVSFHGHTHFSMDNKNAFKAANENYPTMVNTATMKRTEYSRGGGTNDGGTLTQVEKAEGLFVSVYEDYIVVRARDFTDDEWMGMGEFVVKFEQCEYELVKYSAEEVKNFIDGGESSYPTEMEGYVFAGWYKNEQHEDRKNAITTSANVPNEGAYALFVPSHVLGVKAQISGNILDKDKNNDDTASIRFVTTVDSALYKKVGFDVSYTLGDKKTTVTRVSNTVYEKLYAVGDNSKLYGYTPQSTFCNLSTYFKACTVKGLSSSLFSMPFSVQPFWVTVDGSKVYGDTVIRAIDDYFLEEEVWVSSEDPNAANTEENGTEENPFASLDYALGMVRNQGIVHVKDSYTADSEFVWTDHDKTATITGGTVDFSSVPTKTIVDTEKTVLDINDSVTFKGTTLTFADGQHIYANGNSVEIASDVTWGNADASVQIFGGAYNTTLNADTNLVLAKGNYTRVYGGNNKGTLNGDTNVTLSGTINSALATNESYKEHGYTYVVYGGGTNSSTLKGDTNVTIANDTVMFNYVFGGSESGTITGDCNVTYAGKAMSVYAGGKSSKITGNTYLTMSGGWVQQIFGGCESANVIGNTNVDIQSGTVQRRVYGGCYNNADNNILSLSWTTSYKVTGNTNVSISPNATFSLNYSEMDNSIYSLSRYKEVMADEWGAFIFNADSYTNTYKSKLGYNDSLYSSYFSSQTHHYLITTNGNTADGSYGTVSSANDHIRIEPKRGYSATVKVDGEEAYYTEAVAAYKLPTMTNEDEPKNIEVIFSDEFSEVDTSNCEARIGGAYYDTLEDAVNAANALASEDTTIVTLLKNAEVESTMTISSDVTIQNKAGRSITVYRGTGLAKAAMFDVTSTGSLTIQGVETANSLIFDGRMKKEADANTGIDDAIGSSVSMIKNSGTVNIVNATVQYVKKELTNGDGGVISNVAGATLNVTDSLFDNNYTTRYGSVVYNVGSMTFENSTFTNNKSDGNGGVLCHNGGTLFTVKGCTFTGNSGNEGGVIWSNMHYTVDGCTFTENSSTTYGGVILNRSTAKITNSTFQSNEAGSEGGVISTIATTGLIIENCDFIENSATKGGAIRTNDKDITITITGCEFRGNSATSGSGGAMYINTLTTVTITGSTFQSNTSSANGGAIYTQSTKMTTIEGCNFTTNSANYGGAICTAENTSINVTIGGCEFEKNSASANGGAICFGNTTTGIMTNILFEGNQASKAGAITVGNGGKVSFADCEFKDNKNTGSTYEGDDVRLGGASCEIKISGKFVGNVNHRNSSKVQIVGALSAGSAVELDWYDRRTHSKPEPNYFPLEAILFVDAEGNANTNDEQVEANKNYIQLDERTYSQGLELEYEGTTGTVVVDTSVATVNGTPYESLTEAVNAANVMESEGTTIVTLLKNVVVESKMTISGNVTIQNKAGRDITLYRGEGLAAANMFAVNAGGSLTIKENETSGSLTIDGRTKEEADENTGRDAVAGSSSSLINNKGTVNLNDITVQYVKCVKGNGAVIYNTGTSFTASGCTFSYNSGKEGGVIWSDKHYTVEGCTFSENRSIYYDSTIGGGYGGAILNRSTATIKNSTFQSNIADKEGGAISTVATTGLIIENCDFIENSATSGGAIRTNTTIITITITGCEFEGNSATGSGGALVMGAGTTVTVTDTVFEGNEAAIAGAVTVATGGKASFTNCEFKDNSGKSEGNDIRLGGATCEIKISGKFVGNVHQRHSSKVQIVGALTEGSAVELDWNTPNFTLPFNSSVTFASAEVENASKSFIKLGTLTTGYGCELVDSATENALDLIKN